MKDSWRLTIRDSANELMEGNNESESVPLKSLEEEREV